MAGRHPVEGLWRRPIVRRNGGGAHPPEQHYSMAVQPSVPDQVRNSEPPIQATLQPSKMRVRTRPEAGRGGQKETELARARLLRCLRTYATSNLALARCNSRRR